MYKCKQNKICNFAKHTRIKEREKQNISCYIEYFIYAFTRRKNNPLFYFPILD